MAKNALVSLCLFAAVPAWAAQDLSLPGERWLAKGTGYLCGASGTEIADAPAAFSALQVSFTSLTTDYSLDNALIKAQFVEDGNACSYSALMFADNAAYTIKLVESNAFAQEEGASCAKGKAVLDKALAFNDYLYWGRPHHVTVMIADRDAAASCGAEATRVGIDFTLVGRL